MILPYLFVLLFVVLWKIYDGEFIAEKYSSVNEEEVTVHIKVFLLP